MVVDLIEVLSDLGESSVLGDFQLDGYLHIGLGVNADLYLSFYFHNSSRRQHHVSSYFILDLLPTQVRRADAPPLLILLEGVLHVLEVSRRHHQNFLVRKVDELGISSHHLVLLFELIDVAVKFLLEFEVVGD